MGTGGHAQELLEAVGPTGTLIGLDRDETALEVAQGQLNPFGGQVKLIHSRFGELAQRLDEAGIPAVDGALFDLGVSSLQLETAEKGFSFQREGPLDMRMDRRDLTTAAMMVNHLSQQELERLFKELGQERWAHRIARGIVRARPLATTTQLAQVIRASVPPSERRGRIDAATRSFQAIRMAVNRELEELSSGLEQAIQRLKVMGRIVVLSYHSLEDRIVKVQFRAQAKEGQARILTPKPIRPSPEEVAANPRARSARLRALENLG